MTAVSVRFRDLSVFSVCRCGRPASVISSRSRETSVRFDVDGRSSEISRFRLRGIFFAFALRQPLVAELGVQAIEQIPKV